jgi:hypothetical protein
VKPHRPGPRQALAAGLLATALAVSSACTSESGPTGEKVAPTAVPDRSVGVTPTIEAQPVPMRVAVARVMGDRLRKQQRRRLERQVGRLLSDYFDAAFLAGEYPRTDFSGALARFSGGAVERAASDREILTNAGIGAETEAVVPRAKKARLDVLVPRRVVAGLTARVRLVFLRQQINGPDQKVIVKGRLMLNRKKAGPWQIFGYDLSRSSVPAAKGRRR